MNLLLFVSAPAAHSSDMSKQRPSTNRNLPISHGARPHPRRITVERIKIDGTAQLREAVPYLLGFVPEHSVVFIGLGTDQTVSITGRIDAPAAPAGAACVATAIGDALRHTEVVRIVMAYFGGLDPQADRFSEQAKMRPLASAICAQLEQQGVVVADWSWADPLGTADSGSLTPPPIALAHVIAGRRTYRNRSELARQVDPLPSGQRSVIGDCLLELPGLELPNTQLCQTFDDVIARDRAAYDGGHGRPSMSAEEVAMCCHALERGVLRDRMLRLILTDDGLILDAIWLNILQVAPEEAIAPAAMLYATSMYLKGDGVLARCATERALRARPTYEFAATIESVLDSGFPPEKFRGLLREVINLHSDGCDGLVHGEHEDVVGNS